jgi:acid phosphatase type 7
MFLSRTLYLPGGQILNIKKWKGWYRFRTDKDNNEAFSFICCGDAHNNNLEHWSRTVRASYEHFSDENFMLHTGDLALSNRGDYTWVDWFAAGGWVHATLPSVPAPGNSDHFRLQAEQIDQRMTFPQWQANFSLPQNGPEKLSDYICYIGYRTTRFISFYSNFMSIRDNRELLVDPDTQMTFDIMEVQTLWHKEVLENNSQQWTVVYYHQPMFTACEVRHNYEFHNQWRELFKEYKAGSKSRPLDRTNEALNWADIAGENMQLYQNIRIDGETLTYTAWLATGKLFDKFRITKAEPWNMFQDLKPGHELEFEW